MLLGLLLLPAVMAAPRVPGLDDGFVGTSPGYIEASKHLTNALNLSVDPCSDFYEFACGKWIANNPIPADLTSFGNFQKLREKVQQEMRDLYESPIEPTSKSIRMLKHIYKECMDEEKINQVGTSDLHRAIKQMGYWPIMHNEKWQLSSFDLTDMLIHVSSSRGVDVFVDTYVGSDIKNVTRRLLQFDQGTLGLGSGTRDYYLNKEKYAKQLNAYRTLLIAKVRLLSEESGLLFNQSKVEADVDEVIEFETEFAKIIVPEDERRNYTQMYNIRRFSDLSKLMPMINWNKMYRAVTPFSIHEYLNADPEIVISEIAYFDRLSTLLQSTDPRVISNYIIFRYASSWGMQLGTKYDDIKQDFAREMYGRKEKSPRWKDCVSSTNSKITYASGSMYVRAQFEKEAKNTTLAMIFDLQEAFNGMLYSNDWMDKTTKQVAKEKAAAMIKQIGYPDFILDDAKLDDWYKNLDIVSTDSYGESMAKQIKYTLNFQYNRLLEPVDREEFTGNPSTVNAYYSSIKNAIVFPAAILQVPFFHPSYPRALNYGGIGAVIGHEITHGFDDQGRQFDNIGNLREWWDAETSERFKERSECIIKQYGDMEVEGTGLKINGKLTQGENIADNGGIKEAFKAYKSFLAKNGPEKRVPGLEQFDNDQMFFIGYSQTWCGHMTSQSTIRQLLTDPHSPGRYRVNVVLRNQPEFSEAFKCTSDSPMNPAERCAVW